MKIDSFNDKLKQIWWTFNKIIRKCELLVYHYAISVFDDWLRISNIESGLGQYFKMNKISASSEPHASYVPESGLSKKILL